MDVIFDKITSGTMAELEKTQKDFWNIPRQTAVLLNMFIKMMNAKSVLEIGTSNGYSGLWLAKALKATGGRLTTIEFYEKRQSIAIENFKKCGVIDIVKPLRGAACDIIESFNEDEKLRCYRKLNEKLKMKYYQKDNFNNFIKMKRRKIKALGGYR